MQITTCDMIEALHYNNKRCGVYYFNDIKYQYKSELYQLVTFYTLQGEYGKWTGNHNKCDFPII